MLAADADVLCVAELTPRIDAALRAACCSRRYPAGAQAVRQGSVGTGIWARLPCADAWIVNAGYALAAARVLVGGVEVTVVAVHTVAPTNPAKVERWRAGFAAAAEIVAEAPGPVVLAGDWNATLAHGPMRDLLRGAAGRPLVDAHTAAGRWRAGTWPTWLPVQTAGLDRVLVTPDVTVRSIRELRAPGSDHLAVVADLAVRV